jgi:hypothetical protein
MEVRRGFADDVVVGATAPKRVRAGSTIPVRVALRRRGGGSRTVTVQVPIPADVRPGERKLIVEGNGFPDDEDELLLDLIEGLISTTAPSTAGEPRSPKALARAIAAKRRPLGIAAHLRHRDPRVVLRSDEVRFSGRARISLQVARGRR